jgi:hypothetical protein
MAMSSVSWTPKVGAGAILRLCFGAQSMICKMANEDGHFIKLKAELTLCAGPNLVWRFFHQPLSVKLMSW